MATIAGGLIGQGAPWLVSAIAATEVANVALVVAVLIWAMVDPMMVGVECGAVAGVARQPKGLLVALVVNWLIKPFNMALVVFANRTRARFPEPLPCAS